MLQDLLEQQAEAASGGCSARRSRRLLEPLHLRLYEGRQLPVLLGHLQAPATVGLKFTWCERAQLCEQSL